MSDLATEWQAFGAQMRAKFAARARPVQPPKPIPAASRLIALRAELATIPDDPAYAHSDDYRVFALGERRARLLAAIEAAVAQEAA